MIVIVLSGFMLASYNSYTESQRLDQAANQLIDILTLARNKAASGDTMGYGDCSNSFGGYNVSVTSGGYTFNLSCTSTHTIQTVQYSAQTGISLTSAPTATVTFGQLYQGLSGGSVITITVKNSKITTSNCTPVTITPPGVIKQENKITC